MSIVFVISAPSGSGKSTLVAHLMRDVPNLMFSISHTTRKPRGLEKEGESYYYISREEFEERVGRDEFLEYAEVFGNYYGTHKGILERADAAETIKSQTGALAQAVEAAGYRLTGVRCTGLERRTTVVNAGETAGIETGKTPHGVDVRI
jgi:guanylate kinase